MTKGGEWKGLIDLGETRPLEREQERCQEPFDNLTSFL